MADLPPINPNPEMTPPPAPAEAKPATPEAGQNPASPEKPKTELLSSTKRILRVIEAAGVQPDTARAALRLFAENIDEQIQQLSASFQEAIKNIKDQGERNKLTNEYNQKNAELERKRDQMEQDLKGSKEQKAKAAQTATEWHEQEQAKTASKPQEATIPVTENKPDNPKPPAPDNGPVKQDVETPDGATPEPKDGPKDAAADAKSPDEQKPEPEDGPKEPAADKPNTPDEPKDQDKKQDKNAEEEDKQKEKAEQEKMKEVNNCLSELLILLDRAGHPLRFPVGFALVCRDDTPIGREFKTSLLRSVGNSLELIANQIRNPEIKSIPDAIKHKFDKSEERTRIADQIAGMTGKIDGALNSFSPIPTKDSPILNAVTGGKVTDEMVDAVKEGKTPELHDLLMQQAGKSTKLADQLKERIAGKINTVWEDLRGENLSDPRAMYSDSKEYHLGLKWANGGKDGSPSDTAFSPAENAGFVVKNLAQWEWNTLKNAWSHKEGYGMAGYMIFQLLINEMQAAGIETSGGKGGH